MTPSQIVLYSILGLFVLIYLRRFFITRSITRYSPAQAADRMAGAGAVFLDVRTDGERAGGQIKGSLHIPLQQLTRRMEELQPFRQKEIICYCQSGSRSLGAAARLKKAGFTVSNLEGGIAEWNFAQRQSKGSR